MLNWGGVEGDRTGRSPPPGISVFNKSSDGVSCRARLVGFRCFRFVRHSFFAYSFRFCFTGPTPLPPGLRRRSRGSPCRRVLRGYDWRFGGENGGGDRRAAVVLKGPTRNGRQGTSHSFRVQVHIRVYIYSRMYVRERLGGSSERSGVKIFFKCFFFYSR